VTVDEKLYIESIINEYEEDLMKYFGRKELTEDYFIQDLVGRKVYKLHSKTTGVTVYFNVNPFEKCIEAPDYDISFGKVFLTGKFKIHFPGLSDSRWMRDTLEYDGGEYYIPICNLIHEVFIEYLRNREGWKTLFILTV